MRGPLLFVLALAGAVAHAAQAIPRSRLIEFPGLGHAPQIQAPEEFDRRLVDALAAA
jgi:pimeloyl-ACP methyl ester carboxylesterase